MTVSFIPKEMSKHLEEKLSEMEGRQTHVNDSFYELMGLFLTFKLLENFAAKALQIPCNLPDFLFSFCADFLLSIASKWFPPFLRTTAGTADPLQFQAKNKNFKTVFTVDPRLFF